MTAVMKVLDAAAIPGAHETLRAIGDTPAIVRDGESLFAVLRITRSSWPMDEEMVALSLNPQFRAMIEHARQQAEQGLGLPADEVQRQLGITDEEIAAIYTRRARKRQRAPAPSSASSTG